MRTRILLSFVFLFAQGSLFASVWTEGVDRALAEKERQLQQSAQKKKTVHQLLYSCDATQGYDYLITWFEWQELALSEYIRIFDRTRTTAGSWGLEQLTKPIVHGEVIRKRQEGIAKIAGDPDRLNYFDTLLNELKKYEDDFLSYFNEHDQVCRDAEQLYYSYFTSILNKSRTALDYAYLFDSCHAVTNIASLLCITGLINEFLAAQANRKPMDIWRGIKTGLGGLFHDHSLDDSVYQKYKNEGAFAVSRPVVQANLPAREAGICGWMSHMYALSVHTLESVWEKTCATVTKPAVAQTFFYGSFGDKQSFFKEQASMGSTLAFLWVLGQTAYQDHRLWLSVKQNYTRLVFLYTTHVTLQHRLHGVAQWCAKAHELCRSALSIDALREHAIVQRAFVLYADDTLPKIKELLNLLQAGTLAEKNTVFYSRGHVLITHALFREIKELLLPLMQAVGLIDGYISICRVYAAHKSDPDHPFCLVQLHDGPEPEMEIIDGWLPLIAKNHIRNSVSLGGAHGARNMVLTGPNGGGKSSILKLMGGAAVLAHSWGIVPARACSMSVLSGLRTSFNPPEDISQDLSTFMAQKKRLDQLRDVARTATLPAKLLLLIDEPYRGTIEAEAEKRACRLGGELAQYSNCMTVMASHLQMPIELAQTGDFVNRYLDIATIDDTFVRTFKLCEGVAWWWFNDIERRIRFIDWLHAQV